jgi:hypothetical protein
VKNFDALIGVGTAWPASTSWQRIYRMCTWAVCWRRIGRHLAPTMPCIWSTVALRSGAMFNYLKMALGVVPFVGTAIALYDAWNSANLAVAAFLRGDVGHGLAEVEAVLLSLIDAAMDVLPVAGATSSAARAATADDNCAP